MAILIGSFSLALLAPEMQGESIAVDVPSRALTYIDADSMFVSLPSSCEHSDWCCSQDLRDN